MSAHFSKVCSELYEYSYTKNTSADLFNIIEDLVLRFAHLSKEQKEFEKSGIFNETVWARIKEEYKAIVQIVKKIDDREIKERFFGLL